MSDEKTLRGGCLCGAVRFTAAPQIHDFGACHGSMCRRWTAGPLLSINCGRSVEIESDASLGVYRSSEWAERLFCNHCGASLFYRLVGNGETYVSVEAFDDNADFKLVAEIFIDEKPVHYEFANDTRKMTGAEVFAAVAAALADGDEANG